MNNVDKQYFDLLRYILKNGSKKTDRTGTGTISIFDYTLKFNMNEGFPLLTSKKMAWKSIVLELLWFLQGKTNIKWLVENGCNIWNGDAYKNYLNRIDNKFREEDKKMDLYRNALNNIPKIDLTRAELVEKIKTDDKFAKKWGELGPIYGAQWRKWKAVTKEGHMGNADYEVYIDQISDLIKTLKDNPDSRRLIVNAYNVGQLSSMVLPPCHMMFQCYTRELTLRERNNYYRSHYLGLDSIEEKLNEMNIPKRALSLKVIIRSNDIFLGNPFNIASYGLLLLLLSKEVNMTPDELILSIGDAHIYTNHIEQCKQQLKQKTFRLPTVTIADKSIFDLEFSDIILNDYESAPSIKGELSN